MDDMVADAIIRIADALERIVELVEEQSAPEPAPFYDYEGDEHDDVEIPPTF